MSACAQCKRGEPLYKCPSCGATAHISIEKREIVVHAPPLFDAKQLKPGATPFSVCFPPHFGCELAKPITQIDLSKLVKVEAK